MVITVVVPTLHSQGFEKALHVSSPCCTRMSRLWRFDESDVTDVRPASRRLGRGREKGAIRQRRARKACLGARRLLPQPWRSELMKNVLTAALPAVRPAASRHNVGPSARSAPKKIPCASQASPLPPPTPLPTPPPNPLPPPT